MLSNEWYRLVCNEYRRGFLMTVQMQIYIYAPLGVLCQATHSALRLYVLSEGVLPKIEPMVRCKRESLSSPNRFNHLIT